MTKEVIGVPTGDGKALVPSGTTGAPNAAPPAGGAGGSAFLLPVVLMGGLVLMIVVQAFAGRKEKKKRVDMLGQLTRNDRILTTGGIIGQIAEIHENELVIKTDEASNTRVRIMKSAVANVLKKTEAAKA